jgi:hypothetical protein
MSPVRPKGGRRQAIASSDHVLSSVSENPKKDFLFQ